MEALQSSLSSTSTTRDDLSLLYRVLRVVIRPLRPHLVKPGNPLPAGSPRLTNYPSSKNGCRVDERQDPATGLWLYDITPLKRSPSTTSPKHQVLYFAGGGFQSPPASEHWAFVSKLAGNTKLLSEFNFTIVSYPLAPNSPACESLPVLRNFLKMVCEDAAASGGKVTVMGDSAGGNVALSLGLWWIDMLAGPITQQSPHLSHQEDDEATISDNDVETKGTPDTSNPQPRGQGLPSSTLRSTLSNIIVISPAADLRNTNPAIIGIDKHDPVLSAALISQTASAWTLPRPTAQAPKIPPRIQPYTKNATEAEEQDLSSPCNPYISPILIPKSTLSRAKTLGIKIHGAFGTHDVLAPDAELFRQKCIDAEVPGEWLVWNQQMHCFVLAGVYGMMEGKCGIEWVVDVMARNL